MHKIGTDIGIVGCEAEKFSPNAAEDAKLLILHILTAVENPVLVSGHCPWGGPDIWSEEIADQFGFPKRVYAPKDLQWDCPDGYGFKQRNIDIALTSRELNVITVDSYPKPYFGEIVLFKQTESPMCYHCKSNTHVKSGACWTAKKFEAFHDKKAVFWIVRNDGGMRKW